MNFTFIKKILGKIYRFKIKGKVTLISDGQKFNSYSKVALLDGASPKQIELFGNVDMYGTIQVSYHGRVVMGDYSKIGTGSSLLAVNSIIIGKYTAIGSNTTIVDNNNHPIDPEFRKKMRITPHESDLRQWRHSANAPIIIGENVWVGSNVRIQKGVTIGDNSVIAACSVVTKDVPANSIAAGNPAKIVKTNIDKL